MSEWLTTGQMIDRLKVGEKAKLKGFSELQVQRNENGSITWEHGGSMNFLSLNLAFGDGSWEWRILPNYVSFEEAKKALENGKAVICEYEGREFEYETEGDNEVVWNKPNGEFSWYELWDQIFHGKWTIKE